MRWIKSSYSGDQGDCVEVGLDVVGAVPVRDSKNRGGPMLAFSYPQWVAFVEGVRQDTLTR